MTSEVLTTSVDVRVRDLLPAVASRRQRRAEGRLLNLVVDSSSGIPHGTATNAFGAIELSIAPQHVVEYAGTVAAPAPVQSAPILSSHSRLTFAVPVGRSIPLTCAGMLDAITDLALVVTPRAISLALIDDVNGGPGVPVPGNPTPPVPFGVTAPTPSLLVAPARLMWALPGGAARFTHAREPAEHQGRVEQWQSTLGVRTSSGTRGPREVSVPVRAEATLSPSVSELVDPAKINSPVDGVVAGQILTASQNLAPVDLDHLRVSPLGATLELDGDWGTAAVAYRHRIIAGRDDEVRVATPGRLFPFGHRAVMAQTVHREPRGNVDGAPVALVRRAVLSVTDRVKDVGGTGAPGRQWPWRRVEILNRSSPPGDQKEFAGKVAYLEVAGVPFASVCRATDGAGRTVTFTMPLLFVPDGVPDSTARTVWAARGDEFKRVELGGQPVAIAGSGSGARATASPDATTLVVRHATMQMAAQGAKVVPIVDAYLASSPVLAGLGQPAATTIRYAKPFVDHGFGGDNRAELLLRVDGPLTTIGQGVEALASASMQVRAVSRAVGAVAANVDLDAVEAHLVQLAKGTFDPRTWFSGLDSTTLFGVFPLGQLLPPPDGLDVLQDAPTQTAELLAGQTTFTSTWTTELLGPDEHVEVSPAVLRTDGAAMTLELVNTTTPDPLSGRVRTRTTATVEHAVVGLAIGGAELISLAVPSLRFETVDTAAPTVDVQVGKVDFKGPLSWVAALASLLDSTGLGGSGARRAGGRPARALGGAGGNGTGVQVHDDRVEATLVLAVPGLAFGAFSLTDLVFRSDFALFLDGSAPTLSLAFSSPAHPFRVTMALLGGGGHLLVRLSTKELVEVSGSLEFGAAVAVDLAGIVKGSASVMAGIGFQLLPGEVSLSGYVDMRGHLEVLSLVAVTIQVLVLMSYQSGSGKIEGKAEVSVKVKVLFFKKTVKFEVRHEFAGGAAAVGARALSAAVTSQPDPAAWDAYWDSFAAA